MGHCEVRRDPLGDQTDGFDEAGVILSARAELAIITVSQETGFRTVMVTSNSSSMTQRTVANEIWKTGKLKFLSGRAMVDSTKSVGHSISPMKCTGESTGQ